jgi:hypothetical protein
MLLLTALISSFTLWTGSGCWLTEERMRSPVRSCGVCEGISGTWMGFLRALPSALLNPHSTNYSTLLYKKASGTGAVGLIVNGVPSGLSLKPPYEMLPSSLLVLPSSGRVGDAMDYSKEVALFVPLKIKCLSLILLFLTSLSLSLSLFLQVSCFK